MSASVRTMLLAFGAAFAAGGCETVDEAVNEVVGNRFVATLNGANEVPGPGDPDGWGMARITINDAANQVCTDLEVRDLSNVTAAHIHRGGPQEAGPPVITLDAPDDNDSDDCDTASDALVDEIRASPRGFYVNVHTSDFPQGAVRGQIQEQVD